MDPHPSVDVITQLQQHWVWVEDWIDFSSNQTARLAHFQRTFELSAKPSEAWIRVSADTRYKLFVNGTRAAVGPARGCEQRWFYDSVDISRHLKVGENHILVAVLRYFPSVNAGIPFARTIRPGFTLIGRVGGLDISSGEGWRARECEVNCPSRDSAGTLVHCFEVADFTKAPPPWTAVKSTPDTIGVGILPTWRLESRMIPMAEETPANLDGIRRVDSLVSPNEWHAFFGGQSSLELEPNSRHIIEVEYKHYHTAFLNLRATGVGEITIIYAESYASRHEDGSTKKGDRTSRDGQYLFGPSDELRISGTVEYEPFWWRAFRYLLVDIRVGSHMRLDNFTITQTNYPLDVTASWKSDAEATDMWDISIRTLQSCMYDAYSDCPFYEQLQYCEDSRSAMLFHYILSGDDRLARQAITAFADSQLSDGMVCGRAPAHGTQVITGFSLFWVLQICDHHLHFGDAKFATRFQTQIDSVLAYFERHISSKGLVEGLPLQYWSFIDWVQTWRSSRDFHDSGVPLAGRSTGTWSYFSMLYAYTLRQVARLRDDLGLENNLLRASQRVIDAVNKHCYDGEFYVDSTTSEKGQRSQHAQIWAILSGCVEGVAARKILQHSLTDVSFAKPSYPMTHYLFRALAQVGLYDERFNGLWDPWRRMMALHLTTWAEDDVNERSDCHEWSSLPIYEFGYGVLGLEPLAQGWTKLRFAPRPSLAPRVDAAVNLGNRGVAKVQWQSRDGAIAISLTLPTPLSLVTRPPGGKDVDHGVTTSVDLVYTP